MKDEFADHWLCDDDMVCADRVIEDQELVPPMIPMSGRPGFIDRRRATDVSFS